MRQNVCLAVVFFVFGSYVAFLALWTGGWSSASFVFAPSRSAPPAVCSTHALETAIRNWSSDSDARQLIRTASRITEKIARSCEKDLVSPLFTLLRLTGEILDDVRSVTLFIGEHNQKLEKTIAAREAAAFVKYTFKYDIPLDLALAVGYTESHFSPSSRSDYGAAGVMQVSWKIHSALLAANGITSEAELFEPDKGISAGCLLLSRYLRAYETTQAALGRYYGGSPSVYWARVSKNLNKFRTFTGAKDL